MIAKITPKSGIPNVPKNNAPANASSNGAFVMYAKKITKQPNNHINQISSLCSLIYLIILLLYHKGKTYVKNFWS